VLLAAALASVMGILLFVPLLGVQHSFSQQNDEVLLSEMPVERFIPFDDTSNVQDIGIDTSRQILLYLDVDNRALTLYDLRNNLTKSMEIGPYPHAIAVNSVLGKAYVTSSCTCPEGLDLNVIGYSRGIESAKVEGAITGVSKIGAPIALNPNTSRVYVGSGSTAITVVEGANHDEVIGKITGVEIQGIAVNPKTNEIYAIDNATTLYKIDGATNKIVDNVTISLPPSEVGSIGDRSILKAIAVNPNTNVAYVINQVLPRPSSPNEGVSIPVAYLAAVNGTSNTVINSNITRLSGSNFDLAIDPNANTVYVLSSGGREIIEVGGLSNNVVRRDYFPALEESISHLVIDENAKNLYLQGQTGIFKVQDNKTDAPEFHDLMMLVPALAITAAVIITRRQRKKGY
jgi:hypothetical protein